MRRTFYIFAIISLVDCQSDGEFWWLNKNVMNRSSESRSIKDQSAKIRTLPPRYRTEDELSTTSRNSIFIDEDEEDRKMFKYDHDEPDCVCTPEHLCVNNVVITDGSGIIDERSLSICGVNNVCCRLPRTTTQRPIYTTQKTSTTTRQGLLNNIGDFISTILRPVPSTDFDSRPHQRPHQSCSSRKGKKIEKRILIPEDYEGDEDDDDVLVGETSFAEYPWMIEVLKKNRKTGSFEYKCGGVLINPTTALTANHCLKGINVNPSNFIIRAGEWDRSSTLEFTPHHDRQLSQIISHHQYYSGGLYNDIAILKWRNPLEYDVNVAPICLPTENEFIEPGKYCIVTGWGKADDSTPTTDKLKFAKVPIVTREKCERQLRSNRLGARFRLHESFVCAGGESGVDSCTNDGGSPLVCPRSDGSFVLWGLVSWGLECGQKDVPGVYTNVQNLLRWIKSHQGE